MPKRARPPVPEVVVAARDRNDAALAEIYDELQPRLARFVHFNVENSSDADRALSEAIPSVLAMLPHFDESAPSLNAWCFSVVRGELARQDRSALPSSEFQLPAHYLDEGEDRAIERITATGDIRTALRQLPPLWQELLALRILAGLSVEDAAYVLDRSADLLRPLQNRALGALGEWLIQIETRDQQADAVSSTGADTSSRAQHDGDRGMS